MLGKWRFPGQIHVSKLYQYCLVNGVFLGKYTFHNCTAHVHVTYHGVTSMNCPRKLPNLNFFFTRVCTVFHRVNRNTLTFPFTLWMGSTTTATALSESASKLCGNKEKIKQNGYKIAFTLITSLEKNLFLIWVTMFHKRGWLISRSLVFFFFSVFFWGGGIWGKEGRGGGREWSLLLGLTLSGGSPQWGDCYFY